MNKTKNIIFNILFFLLLITASIYASEIILRRLIFSNNSPFPGLKDPGKYADIYSDDYWKLYYAFGGVYRPPEHPHPLLGWVGYFDDSLRHWDMNAPVHKRRVLMFGDSFVMCAHDSIECFQEILNADSAFNKENVLLNYGVGGYGIDQECLLFENVVDEFENPFVVFCLTPTDMDRCLLSARTGQKPYYTIVGDSLTLNGVPVDSIPDNFFANNPPDIHSYLWRRLMNSDLNPWFTDHMNDEQRKKAEVLSEKIILRVFNTIKKRNIPYVFVVFNELWSEDGLWRTECLKNLLSKNGIRFVDTRDVINKDSLYGEYNYDHYILKGNGHPNSHYNKIVCEEIKTYILSRAPSP